MVIGIKRIEKKMLKNIKSIGALEGKINRNNKNML